MSPTDRRDNRSGRTQSNLVKQTHVMIITRRVLLYYSYNSLHLETIARQHVVVYVIYLQLAGRDRDQCYWRDRGAEKIVHNSFFSAAHSYS